MSRHRAARQHGVRLGEARPGRWSAAVCGGQPAGRGVVAGHRSSSPQQPAAAARRPGRSRSPRSQVCRTTPVSSRPAYAETGFCGAAAPRSTTNSSSGANTHQVGVGADRDPALVRPARPGRPARSAIHRDHVGEVVPRARGRASTSPARPSCTEAMPPQACPKSPVSSRFSSTGARRVVGDDHVDVARRPAPAHSRSWLAALADRRAALELGRAVGDVARRRRSGSAGRSRRVTSTPPAARPASCGQGVRPTTGAGRAPGRRSAGAASSTWSTARVLGLSGARPPGSRA